MFIFSAAAARLAPPGLQVPLSIPHNTTLLPSYPLPRSESDKIKYNWPDQRRLVFSHIRVYEKEPSCVASEPNTPSLRLLFIMLLCVDSSHCERLRGDGERQHLATGPAGSHPCPDKLCPPSSLYTHVEYRSDTVFRVCTQHLKLEMWSFRFLDCNTACTGFSLTQEFSVPFWILEVLDELETQKCVL